MIGPKQTYKFSKTLMFRYPGTYNYRMFDIKTGQYIGKMNLEKREKEMYVLWLNIVDSERRKGYGTAFLNFAKSMSEKAGLKGRLRLLASPAPGSLNEPPHIFYRKFGFTTDNRKMRSKIDNCIKNNEQLTKEDPQIFMYYAPKTKKEIGKYFRSIYSNLCSIFN